MDFGCGDIVAGVRLALRIYQCAFAKEDPADVRYKNFQNDILSFRFLLERLNDSIHNAQGRYLDRPRSLSINAYDPLSEDFENERKNILGDFLATLKACEELLDENARYRFRYNKTSGNLEWHLAQQEQRVDELRNRLHLHTEKIRLVLDRLSFDLLTDLDADVDENLPPIGHLGQNSKNSLLGLDRLSVRAHSYVARDSQHGATASDNVHGVSRTIARQFLDYLHVDAPPASESSIPLMQGFDALMLNFHASADGADLTPEKYLLFLKCRWLIRRLKASQGFQTACPGFYFVRAINQVEQALSSRMHAPGGLISYDEGVLLNLPDLYFRIWPLKTPSPAVNYNQPHPLVARANERKILSIEVASDGPNDAGSVTVFKSSDERFRIVTKMTTLGTNESNLIPQTVYTAEDKLIPRYAMPTLVNPSMEIATFSRNEETLYKFNSYRDLYSFQTALTGYDVSHDQVDIRCQFSDDVASLDCVGRLQLWQEPVVLATLTENDEIRRNASILARESLNSRRESLAPSIAPTTTVNWTPEGWEAETIKLPRIVIFTQVVDKKSRSQFAVIDIELEPGIYLDATECGCCKDYDKCSKLVLTKWKKPDFGLRVLYSETDTTGQPNPNTFDLFPFRLSHSQGVAGMASKRTEYLVLKFKSLQDKRQFHQELNLRFRVRDKQIQDQRDFAHKISTRSDKPQGRPSFSPGLTYSLPSSEVSSMISLPPQVGIRDTGPTLAEAIATGASTPPLRYMPSSSSSNANVVSPIIRSPRSGRKSDRSESVYSRLDSLHESKVYEAPDYNYVPASANLQPLVVPKGYIQSSPSNEKIGSPEYYAPPETYVHDHYADTYEPPEVHNISPIVRSPSSMAPEVFHPASPSSFDQQSQEHVRPMTAARTGGLRSGLEFEQMISGTTAVKTNEGKTNWRKLWKK